MLFLWLQVSHLIVLLAAVYFILFYFCLSGLLSSTSQHGGVYLLAFGPKCFVVVSDPLVARYILRDNAFSYDKVSFTGCFCFMSLVSAHFLVKHISVAFLRASWLVLQQHLYLEPCICLASAAEFQGVLAELLEPIMGKGLIPADLDTWKVRRRGKPRWEYLQPIKRMRWLFNDCSLRTATVELDTPTPSRGSLDTAKLADVSLKSNSHTVRHNGPLEASSYHNLEADLR